MRIPAPGPPAKYYPGLEPWDDKVLTARLLPIGGFAVLVSDRGEA
jgi:hypothetical protein